MFTENTMGKKKMQALPPEEAPPATPSQLPLASGIIWRKLERPKLWAPTTLGEELVGYFLKKTVRDGKWGQYEIALIAVPQGAGFSKPTMVGGTSLIQALDGANVQSGNLVRIVWGGWKDLSEGRKMKVYEVFVADGCTVEQVQAHLALLEPPSDDGAA